MNGSNSTSRLQAALSHFDLCLKLWRSLPFSLTDVDGKPFPYIMVIATMSNPASVSPVSLNARSAGAMEWKQPGFTATVAGSPAA